jgi:predicted phage tail protein
MRTVHLYGSMAEQFGPSFRLDVRSLAEAAHALGCQIPGFRRAIEEGRFRVTCGASRSRGLRLDQDLITFGLPAGDLHIVPVVRGAKSGGIGKIIIGTLIAAAAWWNPLGWTTAATMLGSLGASVALTGASQLLSPKKKNEPTKKSFMFDGADNTAEQGGGVSVIIGTCMVNPVTVSAGVTTSDSNGLV